MLRLACAVAFLGAFMMKGAFSWYIGVAIVLLAYLISLGWNRIKILLKTFKRDIQYAIFIFNTISTLLISSLKRKTFSGMLYSSFQKYPSKPAYVDADTKRFLTFEQVKDLSHKIANVFNDAGYRNGDCVALVMENRVEYMAIWFGLSMIGVSTSLINYNLKGEGLRHCIEVCNCKAVIFSQELASSIAEIEKELNIELYAFDSYSEVGKFGRNLGSLIGNASNSPPPKCSKIKAADTILYLYTSGTTGLPKAVRWPRKKVIGLSSSLVTSEDTFYESLPLYHGNALMLSIIFFFNGATTIIKKKFSASQYIEDCCRYNVTVINYIGEVCRYILCQPKSVLDQLVTIRLAIGNGLRASIWQEFQERFRIKRVIEIYGSTEGNFFMFNIEGKIGAVGYTSNWFPFLNSQVKLIKVDEETDEILRDTTGLAIEADVGEAGQPVGKITRLTKFDGYTNKEASKKKIGHNIFSMGDSAFLSGDTLIRDAEGYFYFRDRLGDTFRWKGENVSTNEVEGLISKLLNLADVCVYGVEVPGNEGKAGMACIMIDPEKTVDVENLSQMFDGILPTYSQPVFLRLSAKAVELTGTFKFQKNKLREDGYNPKACGDDDCVYFLDRKQKKYQDLSNDVYQQILNKSIAF